MTLYLTQNQAGPDGPASGTAGACATPAHLNAVATATCALVHNLVEYWLQKSALSRVQTPVWTCLGCRAAMPPGGSRGVPVTKRRKRRWSAASNSVRICSKGCRRLEALHICRRCTSVGAAQVHAPDRSSLLCCSATNYGRSQLKYHDMHEHSMPCSRRPRCHQMHMHTHCVTPCTTWPQQGGSGSEWHSQQLQQDMHCMTPPGTRLQHVQQWHCAVQRCDGEV